MASKSGAERQRAYRARQAEQGDVVRVSFDLPAATKRALEKLARLQGDSLRDALVRAIHGATAAAREDLTGKVGCLSASALRRLARHYRTTERAMLARLIGEADIAVSERMDAAEADAYAGKR